MPRCSKTVDFLKAQCRAARAACWLAGGTVPRPLFPLRSAQAALQQAREIGWERWDIKRRGARLWASHMPLGQSAGGMSCDSARGALCLPDLPKANTSQHVPQHMEARTSGRHVAALRRALGQACPSSRASARGTPHHGSCSGDAHNLSTGTHLPRPAGPCRGEGAGCSLAARLPVRPMLGHTHSAPCARGQQTRHARAPSTEAHTTRTPSQARRHATPRKAQGTHTHAPPAHTATHKVK